MLLREVIGQEKLQQQLVEMVQHQRLSHAMLMIGPEGSGALPLAIAFAQYIVSIPRETEAVVDMFAAPKANTEAVSIPGPDEIEHLPAYQRASTLMHPD